LFAAEDVADGDGEGGEVGGCAVEDNHMRPPDKVPSIVEKRLSYFSMVEKNLPC
jgi:hypothetical protein